LAGPYWLWIDVIRRGDVAGTAADDDDVELTEFSDEIKTGLLKNLKWIG
jgi:N utilization substance protein A